MNAITNVKFNINQTFQVYNTKFLLKCLKKKKTPVSNYLIMFLVFLVNWSMRQVENCYYDFMSENILVINFIVLFSMP